MERGKAEKKKAPAPEGEVRAEPGAPAAERRFYKIGEVCELTDTQPYVLRFWESEFPQLAPRKSRAGQRVYEKQDVDMILRIKKLLYEEEYTIAGARKKLEEEGGSIPPAARAPAAAPAPAPKKAATGAAEPLAKALRALRGELRALRDLLES